jgi:hypothetical protein
MINMLSVAGAAERAATDENGEFMKFSRAHKRATLVVAAIIGVASVPMIAADPAGAAGTSAVTDSELSFGVKVNVGDVCGCSGALVTPWWFVTAKSCFADGANAVTAGAPPIATTASSDAST